MTNGGSKVGKKCVIPFKYGNVFRHGCVVESNHNNRPWCAVARDSNGVGAYIPGEWGYCPSACKLGKTHIEAFSGCKCLIC